nr:cytochrome c oxidase assembly protein [Mycobacterium sp. D16Q16]
MAALCFTPLYAAASDSPALHALIDLHFLLVGYLCAGVIAGPTPHRGAARSMHACGCLASRSPPTPSPPN